MALFSAGLEQARNEGWVAVVVVGDPSYYLRFGFSHDAARGKSRRYAVPALMGLALVENGLGGSDIEYAPAFSSFADVN